MQSSDIVKNLRGLSFSCDGCAGKKKDYGAIEGGGKGARSEK